MKAFLFFELTALLIGGITLLFFSDFPSAFPTVQRHAATVKAFWTPAASWNTSEALLPEQALSLCWLRRTLATPYISWYLHDTSAYATVPAAARLPHDVVERGAVAWPVHALYLWLGGSVLRWTHPALIRDLLRTPADSVSDAAFALQLQQATSLTAVACLLLAGAPAVWCLTNALYRLLIPAVEERVRVARVLLPASDVDRITAAAAGCSIPTSSSSNEAESINTTYVFIAAVAMMVIGFLYLLVLEMSTMQPWCLAGAMVLWITYAVLRDAEALHPSEADSSDEAFEMTSPVIEEGSAAFYALKKEPSLWPLVWMSVGATVLALSVTPGLYLAPVVLLWILTSCWQRSYRRVLVKIRASSDVPLAEVDASGYVRVGYSCYSDRMYLNTCFSYASMAAMATLLIMTTPWWFGQQPLFAFMELLAAPPVQPGSAAELRSYSGAREMQPHCLFGDYQMGSCAQPSPNLWRLSEWLGLGWTSMAQRLTAIFATDDAYIRKESGHWVLFTSVVLLVAANGASILALALYRVRKPPLSFETPVRFSAARAAQEAERQAFWAARRLARQSGDKKVGEPSATTTSSSPKTQTKRATVVTCLCREEYVVKQVVLMCWMQTLAVAAAALLLLRSGPSSTPLLVITSSPLAVVYLLIACLRCTHPLAFANIPSPAPPPSATARDPSLPPVDASALAQQDSDDARPLAASCWATSPVAPSLAHVSDGAAFYLAHLACVLGSGVLVRLIMPMSLRCTLVLLLAAGAAIALVLLRRWAAVDFTSAILCGLGAIGLALLCLLLRAQIVAGKMGDVRGTTAANALLIFAWQSAVASVLLIACVAHATLRIGRLALEPEEIRLVPIEEELAFFSKASAEEQKKQQ